MSVIYRGFDRHQTIFGFAHLLLIFVVLIGIAGIGYLAIKNNVTSPSEVPEITQASPTSTSDPTSSWKTYRNKEYGYLVMHPASTMPMEITDSNDVYENYVRFKNPNSENIASYFAITVSKSSLEKQIEFEKWASSHALVELINETDLVVNSFPAKRLSYQSVEDYDYKPRSFVVVSKGNRAYTISAHPDDIDQILSTFEFVNYKTIAKQEPSVGLDTTCTADSDCQDIVSYNDCGLYCVNQDPSNQTLINSIKRTCDATLWDPPFELNCGCIENNCQLYE